MKNLYVDLFVAFDQERKIAFDPRAKFNQLIPATWKAGLRKILMLNIGSVWRMPDELALTITFVERKYDDKGIGYWLYLLDLQS